MRRSLAAALACVALVAAGCGGGDDDGPDTPKAAETLQQFQARLTTAVGAIGAGQCDAVDTFNAKSGLQLQCKSKELFKGFLVTGAKTYGTGGVVEFRAAQVPQGVGAYTFAIGEDGKYQLTGPIAPVLPASSLDQEPKDADGMDKAAQEMVDAIRANDCNRFSEVVYVPADMPKDQACRQELTEAYGPLRAELAKHKDAKPERLGGNDRFMFYALWTGDQYRTLIVSRTGPGAKRPFVGFVTFRGPAKT
ncbi:MAG TPA: hypothetical protein VF715_08620 [Thermoleophilaceae bacterium]